MGKFVTHRLEPTNIATYMKKFTDCIHFEEAANSKYISQFDLYSVSLELISHGEQTYKVKCIDKNLSPWMKAFEENKIHNFAIEPVSYMFRHRTILGHLQNIKKDVIIVKITRGFMDLLEIHDIKRFDEFTRTMKVTGEKQVFDIEFQMNRIPYLLQHNAVSWMEKHNLFALLISNPKFDEKDSKTTFLLDKFR